LGSLPAFEYRTGTLRLCKQAEEEFPQAEGSSFYPGVAHSDLKVSHFSEFEQEEPAKSHPMVQKIGISHLLSVSSSTDCSLNREVIKLYSLVTILKFTCHFFKSYENFEEGYLGHKSTLNGNRAFQRGD